MTPQSRFRTWRSLSLLFVGVSFLGACASDPATSTKKKRTPVEPGDEFYASDNSPSEQGLSPTTNPDSGAFSPAGERPAPTVAPGKDAGGTSVDGGASDGGTVQPKVFCSGALAAGDLVIAELLIMSRPGSGDDGEWVEIKSARTCWLKVKGLSIESPRGTTGLDTVTITEDFELAPNGTFIVADSVNPARNHALPGKIFSWASTDVLKNDGDTVALKIGTTTVDTLTYPAFSNLEPGRTLAFPSDCPGGVRNDWARWSLTFAVYTAGFKGTPNAANDDVACY